MTAPTPPAAPGAAAPAPEAPQPETFSREYVESLRSEAAKYRTEKNAAVDAAKAAIIQEYEGKAAERDSTLAELQTNYAAAQLDVLKLRSVLDSGISTDDALEVVALVQGTDEESVKASVDRVKALLGKAPKSVLATDASQGSGNYNHVPLNGDPVLNILKAAVGAR